PSFAFICIYTTPIAFSQSRLIIIGCLGSCLRSGGSYPICERRSSMRWQGLFEDLEAQAAALEVAERGAEIEERTRAETAQLALVDRLRPAVGLDLKLRCRGGLVLAGRPRHVGVEWL